MTYILEGILLLQDMDRHGEGRVEILDDIMGIRMSICADEHWGVNEIDIACKQIGFEGAYTCMYLSRNIYD